MKTFVGMLCCLLVFAVPLTAGFADGPAVASRPAIYDAKADGSQQIKQALVAAQKERKYVLLQFGANWCGWCHKLHALFESDPSIRKKLSENYIVVLIDVDKNHNADIVARYGNPVRYGLPVIVILDGEGKRLTTQDTGQLEVGPKHDPQKVLAFLSAWTPRR